MTKIMCECDDTFEFLVNLGMHHVQKVDRDSKSHYVHNGETLFVYKETDDMGDVVVFRDVFLCKTFGKHEAGTSVLSISYSKSSPFNLLVVSSTGGFTIHLPFNTKDIFLRGNKKAVRSMIMSEVC